MWQTRIAALAGMIIWVSGCGGHRSTELRTSDYPVGERWNATLATPAALVGAAQISGTAWMASKNENEIRVEISIENATPGGEHPWHVHRGTCGIDQGILGPPERYEPLKVGGDGKASQSASLPVPIPTTGSYMVNVHASKSNLGTILACGNLAPPVR